MWSVTLALAPAAAWGVFSFGLVALRTLAAAVLSAVGAELLLGLALRRRTLGDGSAVLTGLLVGLAMPPSVPLFVPVAASAFAIGVAKWAFGGLGANWANPALAGYLFAFLSWRELFSTHLAPRLWQAADAVAAATPLASLAARGGTSAAAALPVSVVDRAVSAALGGLLGSPAAVPRGVVDLVLGIRPGAIGEVSALLLLAGAAFLAARRIVAWRIPAAFLSTFALLAWAFGGTRGGPGAFHGNVLAELLGGGLLLGACFMATDPVTSPIEPLGMVLFGIGCGCLTWLVRSLGAYAEGVAFAVVLMNMLTPAIDRLTRRRGRAPRGR
jgi:Na+-translocating ferredoxin:NAD+ oxidoreductase subunit D